MTELPPHAGSVDQLRPGTLLREWRIGPPDRHCISLRCSDLDPDLVGVR
jgi:hypothetical protein